MDYLKSKREAIVAMFEEMRAYRKSEACPRYLGEALRTKIVVELGMWHAEGEMVIAPCYGAFDFDELSDSELVGEYREMFDTMAMDEDEDNYGDLESEIREAMAVAGIRDALNTPEGETNETKE